MSDIVSRPLVQVHEASSRCTMVQSLMQAGKSTLEAQLMADLHSSVLIQIDNNSMGNSGVLVKKYGIALWQDEHSTYLAGSMAAFRALLIRWPTAAAKEVGAAIGAKLGVPFSEAKLTPWPGAMPKGWGERPVLMGILNVTPDSFSDSGRYYWHQAAVQRAMAMVEEGADILDIGGESTRPGALPVPAEDEIARIVPVIKEIVKLTDVPISVDTFKPEVAEAALAAGAAVINDITGLVNPRMVALAAHTGVPVIVMHMQGTPQTMQQSPHYREVVADVFSWLNQACADTISAGVRPEQLIIDPGIGFGKTTTHNLTLLARLSDFQSMGYPVLIGTSRKSVIGNVLGLPVDERIEGTAATVTVSVCQAADIIRVHDVKVMRRVIDMTHAICSC